MEMLRSLNPSYRRDVVPGATELSAIRLPLQDVGRFIDMQDSIYSYRATELLTKRAVVEVNDDIPTYRKKVVKRGRRGSVRSSRNARRGKASSKARRGKATSKKRRRR